MRRLLPILALLLLAQAAPAHAAGPPPPLAGVPLDLRCGVELGADHALLRRHPGQDLTHLWQRDWVEETGDAEPPEPSTDELAEWLEGRLCSLVWQHLTEAGAHGSPADVELPARAVLEIALDEAWLEGSRIVEQRVGTTVMPIAVPHWSLSVKWAISFHIEYRANDGRSLATTPLRWSPRAGAEQDDYAPLRLGPLLEATARGSFRQLPLLLADEGRLGDLLFAMVDRPSGAPTELAAGGLQEHFWQLLVPLAKHRHDAMAFFLSSETPALEARTDLARWFLLNDSDLGLRRDALGWLMQHEPPVDSEQPLTGRMVELMRWLLARDPSPRLRAEVVHSLDRRRTPEVRALLLVGAQDDDPRVGDVALTALRRFPPATSDEMGPGPEPMPPALAPWTVALDGRVSFPDDQPATHLESLALAAGGPAAETWLSRSLESGSARRSTATLARLAEHPAVRVRRAALAELGTRGSAEDEAVLVDRVRSEPLPALRVAAIQALRPRARDAVGALLQATRALEAEVRDAAVKRLTGVGEPDVVARLQDLGANDPNAKVRRGARKALRKL